MVSDFEHWLGEEELGHNGGELNGSNEVGLGWLHRASGSDSSGSEEGMMVVGGKEGTAVVWAIAGFK